jgi:hypothetical protein
MHSFSDPSHNSDLDEMHMLARSVMFGTFAATSLSTIGEMHLG